MNVLIVTAHPEPASFTSHLARTSALCLAELGHDVLTRDLYAQRFAPCESGSHFAHRNDPARFFVQAEQKFNDTRGTLPTDVSAELEKLHWADRLVLQFPLWWFGMPAILKGWMDRVFVYGGMYS